jgi:hypothetical protein
MKKFSLMTIFFLSELFVLYVLRHFSVGSNLLFEQILFSAISPIILLILLNKPLLRRSLNFGDVYKEVSIMILVFILAMSFSLVNVDRSRSFYVLSWVGNQKITCTETQYDLSQVQSEEKFNVDAISSRIDEQISRGLISISEDGCDLTNSGKVYLFLANTLAKIFFLDYWYKNRF